MARLKQRSKNKSVQLPVIIEQDKDGFYVAECPVLEGCYTQGRTLDEALKNIREVVALVMEEQETQDVLENYQPQEMSFHTITL